MSSAATSKQIAWQRPEGFRGCRPQALVVLCERTECDVRSCLNTLQFLARRGTRIRVADIKGLNVGQKDMTKGAFSIWTELLSTKVGAEPMLAALLCWSVFQSLFDWKTAPRLLPGCGPQERLCISVVAKTHSLTICTEQHMIGCVNLAPLQLQLQGGSFCI